LPLIATTCYGFTPVGSDKRVKVSTLIAECGESAAGLRPTHHTSAGLSLSANDFICLPKDKLGATLCDAGVKERKEIQFADDLPPRRAATLWCITDKLWSTEGFIAVPL
jgi:hypothetical protein